MSSWPNTVLEVQSALPFLKREDQFKEKFGMLMQSAIGNGLVITSGKYLDTQRQKPTSSLIF